MFLSSLASNEFVDTCARAVAQTAIATGGPQGQAFCDITAGILKTQAHNTNPTLSIQLYCILSSFKHYSDLASSGRSLVQEAIILLGDLADAAEQLPDLVGTQFTTQLSEYRDECRNIITEYWNRIVQPRIEAAALYLVDRKKATARRVGSPCSRFFFMSWCLPKT